MHLREAEHNTCIAHERSVKVLAQDGVEDKVVNVLCVSTLHTMPAQGCAYSAC